MKNYLPKLLTMTSALAVAFSTVLVTGPTPAHAAVELNIESWRSDDIDIWNDTILPAFHAKNPDIKVVFAPTPLDGPGDAVGVENRSLDVADFTAVADEMHLSVARAQ